MADVRENMGDAWRIDKRISLDHLLTPLLWVGTFAYIIATANGRIDNLEENKDRTEKFIEAAQTANGNVTDRLARVETELAGMKDQVRALNTVINRIDRKLPTFKDLDDQDNKP